MSVISRLSSSVGRKDQEPNLELARELRDTRNEKAIAELVENLSGDSKAIQHDCIKVLYSIGYDDAGLISKYVSEFLHLLRLKDNHMVWGAMIALSTIAAERADEIYASIDLIFRTIETGSIITIDNGISVLAQLASTEEAREKEIVPYLLEHLQECRPKEIAQHAEKSMAAMNASNKAQFVEVIAKRVDSLSASQKTRVKKVLRKIEKI